MQYDMIRYEHSQRMTGIVWMIETLSTSILKISNIRCKNVDLYLYLNFMLDPHRANTHYVRNSIPYPSSFSTCMICGTVKLIKWFN